MEFRRSRRAVAAATFAVLVLAAPADASTASLVEAAVDNVTVTGE